MLQGTFPGSPGNPAWADLPVAEGLTHSVASCKGTGLSSVLFHAHARPLSLIYQVFCACPLPSTCVLTSGGGMPAESWVHRLPRSQSPRRCCRHSACRRLTVCVMTSAKALQRSASSWHFFGSFCFRMQAFSKATTCMHRGASLHSLRCHPKDDLKENVPKRHRR